MPVHSEKKELPYTAEQIFDLVADVDAYQEFLPWCAASRVTKREGDIFYADLAIGYKMFRESFTSRVTALRPGHIHVEYINGPMKHLSNHWRFTEPEMGRCLVDFYVDFEFKNPLMRRLSSIFLNEIVRRMVGAFEARARVLYR